MLSPPAFRRFVLQRVRDHSGVSGTGTVAHGVLFPSGEATMQWRATREVGPGSVAVFDSIEQLVAIHGHAGDTVLCWLDPVEPVFVLVPPVEPPAAVPANDEVACAADAAP